jgi:hypothetical protein
VRYFIVSVIVDGKAGRAKKTYAVVSDREWSAQEQAWDAAKQAGTPVSAKVEYEHTGLNPYLLSEEGRA